jgi:Fe-S cluster biogenesis protein NfuA
VRNEKDFQNQVQRIAVLVREIEDIADPALRATTKALVQLLMELHGNGLERMMEIAFQTGEPGARIIEECGRDSLVSSLLVLYGLHPDDLPTRVTRALDRIRPSLRKQGSEVTLLAIDDEVVRVRIEAGAHTCGSTVKTLQSTVEEALYEAAPDMTSLLIEGLDREPASGFVALETLMAGHVPVPVEANRGAVPRVEGAD